MRPNVQEGNRRYFDHEEGTNRIHSSNTANLNEDQTTQHMQHTKPGDPAGQLLIPIEDWEQEPTYQNDCSKYCPGEEKLLLLNLCNKYSMFKDAKYS